MRRQMVTTMYDNDRRPTVDRQSTDRFFGEVFFTITNVWISLGENCCFSLLELKGLTSFSSFCMGV